MLRRRLIVAGCLALALALWAPAGAHAGTFSAPGSVLIYNAAADDIDQIAGFETPTTYRFTRFGGGSIGQDAGCVLLDGVSDTIDCKKEGVSSMIIDLGNGDDIATISADIKIPVFFFGGSGRDGLFGGGGIDTFNGGADDDNIVARDGRPENIDCGAGNDTAISDDADSRVSCEQIEGDADSDGVRRPADCDDTNPTIRPGVVDIPDNGRDEDCSGVDAINADRDGDGVPRPQDCDDTNAAIRPGIREVRGNDVDENCDTRTPPFPPLSGSVSSTWTGVGRQTRNLTLVAKDFPAGTRITLRCLGSRQCPDGTTRRTVKRARSEVNLHAALGRRALSAGARIELRMSRAQRIGRLLRYRIKSPGAPDVAFLCAPPGVRAGPC